MEPKIPMPATPPLPRPPAPAEVKLAVGKRRTGVAAVALGGLLAVAAWGQPAAQRGVVVRIGISTREMANTNRADVQAAMKVWMKTFAREKNLDVDPDTVVFDSLSDMADALRLKQLDVVTASTDEFLVLEKVAALPRVYAARVNGKVTEQYVLLVRDDGAFKGLGGLRGQPLVVLDSPRTTLAPIWLDTKLMRDKLPVGARFFGKVSHAGKLNLAILPVFFKQAGAALVTRAGFETAVELNPQLAKELRILAGSPDLIPSLTAYRSGGNLLVTDNYRKEAARLREDPAGKLILDLFQIEGVTELQPSDLVQTRDFLADYARLKTLADRAEAGRRGTAP